MRAFMRGAIVVAGISGLGAAAAVAASDAGISSGPVESRVDALAKIQPGLGTVMTDYGNRFVDVFYAAKGGNWGLAQYQLNEMREIQEVGEATRPNHAEELKGFEEAFLDPLAQAILKKDRSKFNGLYRDAIGGCNGCHAGTGHEFIHFHLPNRPVEAYLDFSVKTDPVAETDHD